MLLLEHLVKAATSGCIPSSIMLMSMGGWIYTWLSSSHSTLHWGFQEIVKNVVWKLGTKALWCLYQYHSLVSGKVWLRIVFRRLETKLLGKLTEYSSNHRLSSHYHCWLCSWSLIAGRWWYNFREDWLMCALHYSSFKGCLLFGRLKWMFSSW